MDSFANALIAFIALDPGRFHQSAQYFVSLQPRQLQQPLLDCLQQLITARNVLLEDISKANRMKFVQNFRDFSTRLKSLSIH